ncbi:MAG TPA: SDR family oxidoreductase [Burkholderiaceae bacterium]
MKDFTGKVAVITGAGSGFGREFARIGARLGMKLALADVNAGALEASAAAVRAQGADVLALRCDVSQGDQVQALADAALARFGAIHLVFNNAGVAGTGGFIWENSEADWRWTLGVNLWGVVHGIRVFVPILLAQDCDCHVVNTASVAGLISPQMMGVYNVSKHAVVAASETLYQDLRIAEARVGVSVLCPAFVPTGIFESHRNRPQELRNTAPPTESQKAAQRQGEQAVRSGKLSAADVAERTFDAVRENRFYVLTHPRILQSVELRMQDILAQRNPSDPFSFKPDVRFSSSPKG